MAVCRRCGTTLGREMPGEQEPTRRAQCGECRQRRMARDRQRIAAETQDSCAWHLAIGQVVQGPFTREQILELRARGECDAFTLVHRSGWSEWRLMESIASVLVGDRTRHATPVLGSQSSNAERVVRHAQFYLAGLRVALGSVLSRALRGSQSRCARLASRVQLAAQCGLKGLTFALERGGERLRAIGRREVLRDVGRSGSRLPTAGGRLCESVLRELQTQ